MSWTDERIASLRVMWEAGQTASQIAEALGDVSRNAVIGKAHRIGLQARPLEPTIEKASKMSSLRVKQVRASLGRLFGTEIDVSDLNPNDKQLDEKRATRELAAFAILRATGCSPEEAARAVTDGSHDNGVDAVL